MLVDWVNKDIATAVYLHVTGIGIVLNKGDMSMLMAQFGSPAMLHMLANHMSHCKHKSKRKKCNPTVDVSSHSCVKKRLQCYVIIRIVIACFGMLGDYPINQKEIKHPVVMKCRR